MKIESAFQKYPSLEIVADGLEPVYRVKYIECVNELGAVRFEKREARVSKESIESLIGEIIMVTNIVSKVKMRD